MKEVKRRGIKERGSGKQYKKKIRKYKNWRKKRKGNKEEQYITIKKQEAVKKKLSPKEMAYQSKKRTTIRQR